MKVRAATVKISFDIDAGYSQPSVEQWAAHVRQALHEYRRLTGDHTTNPVCQYADPNILEVSIASD
jgi:hypothetical protein